MTLRVMVVQHGEKRSGAGDPGLTEAGHRQAEHTARWFAERLAPVAIWTSPLRRARETAQHLAVCFELPAVVDARLRERMNWSDGAESIEAFLKDWARASTERSYQPHTGDSSHAAADRFLDALEDLHSEHADGTAIVVAHGGVTTDALRTVLGDEEVRARAPDLIEAGIPGCAITTLSKVDGTWRVDAIASTAHLTGRVGEI